MAGPAPWGEPVHGPKLPAAVLSSLDSSGGWLGSYWPGAALLTSAALLVVVFRRRRVRARGRLLVLGRRTIQFTVIVLLAGLGGAALTNAYVGYLPDSGALAGFVGLAQAASSSASAADHRAGRIRWAVLADPALRVPPSALWIYTPSGYEHTSWRYPVVYLFHGYPGQAADWFRAGRIAHIMDVLVAQHLVPPAIVVSPDLNGGGINDTEGLDAVRGPRIATWFTRDVVGWTDSRLRTIPDRDHRVIGGMSSGGYAALDIALHHLDEFGAVLALEPYGDPGPDAVSRLGGTKAFRAHSPAHYLPGMRFTRPLPVFIDVGSWGDPGGAARLAAELRADRQPVLFRVEPDQGHTWTEVRAGTPYGLVFVFQQLSNRDADVTRIG